jgi:hypothetical protein
MLYFHFVDIAFVTCLRACLLSLYMFTGGKKRKKEKTWSLRTVVWTQAGGGGGHAGPCRLSAFTQYHTFGTK